MGDQIRQRLGRGAALVAFRCGEKTTLLSVVTEDLIAEGVLRADQIVREAAQLAGGTGGGRSHLAMAGVADPSAVAGLLAATRAKLAGALGG